VARKSPAGRRRQQRRRWAHSLAFPAIKDASDAGWPRGDNARDGDKAARGEECALALRRDLGGQGREELLREIWARQLVWWKRTKRFLSSEIAHARACDRIGASVRVAPATVADALRRKRGEEKWRSFRVRAEVKLSARRRRRRRPIRVARVESLSPFSSSSPSSAHEKGSARGLRRIRGPTDQRGAEPERGRRRRGGGPLLSHNWGEEWLAAFRPRSR